MALTISAFRPGEWGEWDAVQPPGTAASVGRNQQGWLQIEWLPGYAADLNPAEGVWNNIKAREMATLCPDALEEATSSFRRGLQRLSPTARAVFDTRWATHRFSHVVPTGESHSTRRSVIIK